MDSIGTNYGFITLWGLHILSVIAFFVGLLFFIILAAKTFTPAQLKAWAIWLVALGTVVCLITIAFLGRPWIGGYWMDGMRMETMNRMMQMMIDHDEGADVDEREDHDDMREMMRMMR